MVNRAPGTGVARAVGSDRAISAVTLRCKLRWVLDQDPSPLVGEAPGETYDVSRESYFAH